MLNFLLIVFNNLKKLVMKLISYIFVVAFFFIACSPKTKPNLEPGGQFTSLEAVARNNFKSDYKILYNSNKTFAAVYEEKKVDSDDYPSLKIMLFDTKNNSVVWGRKAYRGNVTWESKSKLKVDYYESNNKRSSVVYDTKTKEVTYLQ
jgi:hypothetical protein